MDNISPMTLAAAMALGAGGGSGGGVTKEYVDTQVGAVSERVEDVEDVIPSAATPQNPLATAADVSETAIISTSTTSPLTDSADGMVQGLTVYGSSRTSKNLINPNDFVQRDGYDNISVSEQNGTISVAGYTSAGRFVGFPVQLVVGKTYTINTGTPVGVSGMHVSEYDEKPTAWVGYDSISLPIPHTFVATKLWALIWFEMNADPATIPNLQLEEGSTATDYKPYFDGIKSVGDDGLTVTTANSDNTLTTSANFTTGLPLRSTLDGATRDELIIGKGKAEVITRCEVVDDNIVPLTEPVTTPLTTAEISAFRGLCTYDSTTNVVINNGIVVYSPMLDSNNNIITDSQNNGLIGVSE